MFKLQTDTKGTTLMDILKLVDRLQVANPGHPPSEVCSVVGSVSKGLLLVATAGNLMQQLTIGDRRQLKRELLKLCLTIDEDNIETAMKGVDDFVTFLVPDFVAEYKLSYRAQIQTWLETTRAFNKTSLEYFVQIVAAVTTLTTTPPSSSSSSADPCSPLSECTSKLPTVPSPHMIPLTEIRRLVMVQNPAVVSSPPIVSEPIPLPNSTNNDAI